MRSRPLLAWAGVFIAAGGVFLFSKTVTVLSLRTSGRTNSMHFKLAPSEPMTLCYTNSIYGAPVEERFELRKGDIVLKAVRTGSPAVMEYYGFESSGPLQSLNRSLGPALSVQISMRQDQSLKIGARTVDLRALGNPGDHVQIRVQDVSLASFLLSKMICRQGADAFMKNP